MADLDHLLALGFATGLPFKSNLKVVTQEPPQRERQAHGEKLLRELARLRVDAEELNNRRAELGLNEATGMTIVLEISPPGSLDLSKKLEWRRDGIEVLSSNLAGGTEVVALYVPDGNLPALLLKEMVGKANVLSDLDFLVDNNEDVLIGNFSLFNGDTFDGNTCLDRADSALACRELRSVGAEKADAPTGGRTSPAIDLAREPTPL